MYNPLAALVGPGGGIPPSTLDGATAIVAQQVAQTRAAAKSQGMADPYPGITWKSFYGERKYDTARVVAGTVLPQTEFPLFVNPVGSQQTAFNGTTQYQKTPIDTNMQSSRALPAGEYMWVTSIQCRVVVDGNLDNTTQTGANLSLANDPGIGSNLAAADDILAPNLITATVEGVTMKFEYNQVPFEKGPLYLFPTKYLISGVSGQAVYLPAATGTTIVQNETLLQNGNFAGAVYTLPVIREIQQLYLFGVTLQAFNNFVPTANYRIIVILNHIGTLKSDLHSKVRELRETLRLKAMAILNQAAKIFFAEGATTIPTGSRA